MRSNMSAALFWLSIRNSAFSLEPSAATVWSNDLELNATCQVLPSSCSLVRTSYLYIAKPCRGRAMSRSHHLLGLAFPAVRGAPHYPLISRADRVHRVPKLRRNSRVRRVLQHSGALAVLNFPPHFAAELEVVTLVIDRP